MIKPARILIADDHEFVRQGIRAVLEKQGAWKIIAEAGNGREAVKMAEQFQPEGVIIDISMPELNGLDATRQILRALPRTRVLVLSMHDSEQIIREVLAAGARGYILKSDAARELVAGIESLLQGRPFFTSRVSELLLSGYLRQDQPAQENVDAATKLTLREREILQKLAEGRSNKEIAAGLNISVRTVETHRSNLMTKLDLHSVADLVRYALKHDITT
jgi:DNA-binding NarL/FixJ family response regulator